MKVLLYIICFLSLSNVFGQDTEMLGYINQYRKQLGKTSLVLSSDLTKISVEQTNKIITDDSLSHSHKTSEIATLGEHLPSTVDSKLEFFVFVESVMGMEYEEPKTETEVVKYVKLYCLYMFDKSPKHKKILLGDYKNVGFETVIKNITFKSNEVVINGKTVTFKNIKSHYLVDFYCVINFD
jgi:hypothetical protein